MKFTLEPRLLVAYAQRRRLPANQQRALWVSSSLSTYGGIATFVRNMRDTSIWGDWNIRHIGTHCDGSKARRILIFCWGLSQFIYEMIFYRPQIVHLHTSERGSFVRKGLLVWVSAVFRVPALLHMHGGEFHVYYDHAPAPMQNLIRTTLARASVVIALGSAWAARLQQIAPAANVVVIPNAIKLRTTVDQVAPAQVQVVFLGELCERKGIDVLLDAWGAMMATGCAGDAKLIVAGWGEIDRARVQIASLGIGDSVHLAGWLSAPDSQALLAASHVLVLPSINEGQPMAILEAMTRGLCVVSTTVGGIPEMIGDAEGLLVRPGDRSALAGALLRVVVSEDARRRFGANARLRVERQFDIDVVSRTFGEMYQEVIASHPYLRSDFKATSFKMFDRLKH